FSLSTDKYHTEITEEHFLSTDFSEMDFGESMKNIYAISENTEILEYSDNEIHFSASTYGKGRSVYLAGLPFNIKNTRLLFKSMMYAANKEADYLKWHSENPECEVNVYPDAGWYAIVNNSLEPQQTTVYDGEGKEKMYNLKGSELVWERIE
ncbi:MAG: lacto-N-biose phosphorylase central domain-containing protein, partial [Alkalibacterium sp.]